MNCVLRQLRLQSGCSFCLCRLEALISKGRDAEASGSLEREVSFFWYLAFPSRCAQSLVF
jgi:hypothetical protein